jgi:hypothetical protein
MAATIAEAAVPTPAPLLHADAQIERSGLREAWIDSTATFGPM